LLSRGELSPYVNRMLQTLSHYRFRTRLRERCDVTGRTLYHPSEAYTTKMCGNCGVLHKVGSNKTYRCSQCDYMADRDVHGARNILIRSSIL